MLLTASCGGSDDDGADPTTAASETTTTSETTSSAETSATTAAGGGETPAVTEQGSFTVDDQEFAVTFLNRCIPFGGADSSDIDLQPIAQGQGAQLNLYGTADSLEVSVQGRTVEEIGGSIAFAADPFNDGEIRESSISGDRWTGSATLADSLGSGSTVEVTWDVMIPADMEDCSL